MADKKPVIDEWELDPLKICPLNLTGDDTCEACT